MISREMHEHEIRRIADIMGPSSACASALRRADEYRAEGHKVKFALMDGSVVVIALPNSAERDGE